MRLLLLIDHFGSGGAQRQIVNLSIELARRGHAVEFAIYYPSFDYHRAEVEDAGIPVHEIPKTTRYSWSVPWRLRRLLANEGYDAVLAYLDTPSIYAVLSVIGRTDTALVVSERSVSQQERPSPLQWFRTNLYRRADHIVANSHTHREWMQRNFAWTADRVSTIYNGVDTQRFSPPQAPYVRRDKPKLVAVGTLSRNKNALGLLRALGSERLAGRIESLTWVGKPDETEAGRAYRAEIDAYAAGLGTRIRWNWLGEQRDVAPIVREHDALIHPSYFEGLPNAACEALACARPVLIGRVGDHPKLVREGGTGFLFDPHDEGDISSAVERFLALDAAEYRSMCEQARSFATSNLSLAACASAYERVLERSVASRRVMGGARA